MADQKQQLAILRHALGVGEHGWDRSFRNHYVTGAGGADHAICMELVAAGLMLRGKPSVLTGGSDVFVVTDIGRAAVAATADQKPKVTRAQRRYRAYLDSDTSASFIDWLRGPYGRACDA